MRRASGARAPSVRRAPCAAAALRRPLPHALRTGPRGGLRLASSDRTEVETKEAEAQDGAAEAATNGAAAAAVTATEEAPKKDDGEKSKWDPEAWQMDASALAPLEFKPLSGGELMWARLKMAFALPWRRFKKGSVLTFKVRVGSGLGWLVAWVVVVVVGLQNRDTCAYGMHAHCMHVLPQSTLSNHLPTSTPTPPPPPLIAPTSWRVTSATPSRAASHPASACPRSAAPWRRRRWTPGWRGSRWRSAHWRCVWVEAVWVVSGLGGWVFRVGVQGP